MSAFEGDHQYSFNHALVRDVAYELLPRARRQERHREVARFFEDSSGEFGEAARHSPVTGATRATRSAPSMLCRGRGRLPSAAGQSSTPPELYREAYTLVPEDDARGGPRLRRRLALAEQASLHVLDARLMGLGDRAAG